MVDFLVAACEQLRNAGYRGADGRGIPQLPAWGNPNRSTFLPEKWLTAGSGTTHGPFTEHLNQWKRLLEESKVDMEF